MTMNVGDHAEVGNHQKTEKRPVAIRSRDVELDCRSIVNQIVSSIPKDLLLRTPYRECQQTFATQTAREVSVELRTNVTRSVQLTETKEEYEPNSDCSSGDKTLFGESCTFRPGKDDLSGETMSKRPRDRMLSGESTSERPRDRILSGVSRNIINKSEDDDAESISSSDDSQSQPWENV